MAFLHEEEDEDDHTHTDERKEYGAENRYSSKPQKAHLTSEFVIVAKFGGLSLEFCSMVTKFSLKILVPGTNFSENFVPPLKIIVPQLICVIGPFKIEFQATMFSSHLLNH